MEDAFIDEF